MNVDGSLRTRIGAMVSQGLAVDTVREALFLKGASEVWGGPEMDAQPAWYFWLATSLGAYRLRLLDTEPVDATAAPALRGVFSVKYYPSPREPVFRHFSALEQALVQSECFDHTNTPRFDTPVPEHLFNVGTMELIQDRAGDAACFVYTGLDRMLVHEASAACDRPGCCTPEPADPRARPRQLPAWDLGFPLFEAVVGLHAFLTKTPPKRIVLSRQPGMEFTPDQSGELAARDANATELRSLLVAFSTEPGAADPGLEDALRAQLLAAPWTPVLDAAARRCGAPAHTHEGCCGDHRHGVGCDAHAHGTEEERAVGSVRLPPYLRTLEVGGALWEVPLALNEQWWLLADPARAGAAALCGCH